MLYWFHFINTPILIYISDGFPQLSENRGVKTNVDKWLRDKGRRRKEVNEREAEVKGHLSLWITLPFKLEEGGGDAEGVGGGARNGACYIMTSLPPPTPPHCLLLVLIQSEWLHTRLSTDWAEMQIHSESRVLIRMRKKHPRRSSEKLCLE